MKIRFTGNTAKAIEILQGKPMVIDGVVRWGGGGWVKTFEEDGRDVVYRPSHWEEVPEKVWRDVTAECEAGAYVSASDRPMISILHQVSGRDRLNVLHDRPNYRLRKVRMYLNVEDSGDWVKGRDAFIVEKSE